MFFFSCHVGYIVAAAGPSQGPSKEMVGERYRGGLREGEIHSLKILFQELLLSDTIIKPQVLTNEQYTKVPSSLLI